MSGQRLIVDFQRRSSDHDWFNTDFETSLCAEGLREYVSIPRDINEFQAIFTVEQPATANFFELEEQRDDLIGVKTEGDIAWVTSSRRLMREAWDQGYRFYEVRYKE